MAGVNIISYPSPNFGPRRLQARPDTVVIHYTAMSGTAQALERLCAPEHEVSAHYLIAPDGRLFQLVDESQRAWHAGAGRWGDCTDVNSRSFGIELANDGRTPFPDAQIRVLTGLLQNLMARWNIRPERVIAHSDMAPSRKGDPGGRFDWKRLALEQVSVWPTLTQTELPTSAGATDFLVHARRFGYDTGAGLAKVLAAFRMRFRPWARGPVDETDMALIGDLAARFPVDRAG